MGNFPFFYVGDYIGILTAVRIKRLHINYDNVFMFQSHPKSLKQMFRTGGKINTKVVVRAEILPRDFLQTPGNYYL